MFTSPGSRSHRSRVIVQGNYRAQNLMVGDISSSQLSIGGNADNLENLGTTAATGGMALGMFNGTAGTAAHLDFYRSKSASMGSATVVASGDALGNINWYGAQQTGTFATQTMASQIRCEIDGTVTSGATGDMPGRLVFATTADNAGSVTDQMTLTSAGYLLLHSGVAANVETTPTFFQVANAASEGWGQVFIGLGNNANAPGIACAKTRGSTPTTQTILVSSDTLYEYIFFGSDGVQYQRAGRMACEVDASPGAGSMPGRWVFETTPSGTAATVERFRIDNKGNVLVNNAAVATNATDGFLYIPTCAGTPTGTPTAYTGRVPMVYDTVNNKFYIYNSGWKGGTNPGAFT